MDIKLNIDSVGFQEKPANGSPEFGMLRKRLCAKDRGFRITPEDLMEKIVEKGISFTPARVDGTTGDTWRSQQVICADIDNDMKDENGHKVMIPHPMFPDQALEVMQAHGIRPYFMYHSFHSTDAWPRYRVVLILDQALTDRDQRTDLIRRFNHMFLQAVPECTDTSSEDFARIYLGGRPGCVFYKSGEVTPISVLQALPAAPEKAPKEPHKDTPPSQGEMPRRREAGAPYRSPDELEAMFEYDKKNFDLMSFVLADTGGRISGSGNSRYVDPCPICGGHGDFHVSGYLFYCHSRGQVGGSIIDYLKHRQINPLTDSEAMDFFKFQIMGYDREEWDQAWRAKRDEERAMERAREEAKRQKDVSAADALKVPEKIPDRPEEPPVIAYNAQNYLLSLLDADKAYFAKYKDRKMGLHKEIDRHLTLYPGLAALGGASSLGKTTFVVNVIDKLLDRGETVLYFSLEQLPIEIMTKFLARKMYVDYPQEALTNTAIKDGASSPLLDAVKIDLVNKMGKLEIITGSFHTTVKSIRDYVQEYMKTHSCAPVVIIDYLQLIAPPAGFRGGIRENTDENIKALKDMQKSNGLFVIMISSFNRASNYEPVSYESFKETSMIEFTCDYVWGLQLSVVDAENTDFYYTTGPKGGKSLRQPFSKKKIIGRAQADMPKQVEFISLKSRNGKQFYKAYFNYYPQYDYYLESTPGGCSFAEYYKDEPEDIFEDLDVEDDPALKEEENDPFEPWRDSGKADEMEAKLAALADLV